MNLADNTRYHRGLGHLWWVHGRMSIACSEYGKARDLALAEANAGQAALAQASLTLAASFEDRALADEQIELAEDLLRGGADELGRDARSYRRPVPGCWNDLALPDRAAELALQAEEAGLASVRRVHPPRRYASTMPSATNQTSCRPRA